MSTSTQLNGLSQKEADRLLRTEGFNEISSQKKKNGFFTLLKILSEPMLILLMIGGSVYLYLGDIGDAIMLLFAIFVVIGITFYQERKTEKTLEALKDLSSPRAFIIRDGEQQRIPGREVVRGDVLLIREGDRVPADATIITCENLTVDESLLTGESIPVRKTPWDNKTDIQRPGGEDLPFIYSGSLITSGHGIAIVHVIGSKTEIGKIGKSLESVKEEDTLLHKETKKIVWIIALVGAFLCVFVFVFYAIARNNPVQGILSGLTLSMAILPEEFPVVLLVFLTLGAWRISKRKVLTRRSAAIETLGAATVLCTDKTGTLTLNKMKLNTLYSDGFYELSEFASTDLSEKFKNLLTFGVLASQKDAFDPMEKELIKMGDLYLHKKGDDIYKDLALIREYPLSKDLLALSHVWKSEKEREVIIASKGSPEAILHLCHVTGDRKKELLQKVKEMSERGLRVLGVARSTHTKEVLPKDQNGFDYEFVGLLGFVDPIRPTVINAVKEAYQAGINIMMITGDYPGTAQHIAKKIGLKNPKNCLTGEDVEKLDHLELRKIVQTTTIFARVVPEQKLRIVNALKANDEVVAMTGDGVNDAPALKAAHIGVAMGEKGTDVAREAASLVLLNDDFSSIVSAVRLGRRIYTNLKQAMGYILSIHVPIAGISVIPLFFDFPVVLFPAHVAFLELIIDPACSIVFESEKEDKDIMRRPPRNLHEPIFRRKNVLASLLQGLAVLVATFALYAFAIQTGRAESEARAFAFISLVLGNLILIVTNLSQTENFYKICRSGNKTLTVVAIGALTCLGAVLYIPFLSTLFHLTPPTTQDLLLIIIVTLLSLAGFELSKIIKGMQKDKAVPA